MIRKKTGPRGSNISDLSRWKWGIVTGNTVQGLIVYQGLTSVAADVKQAFTAADMQPSEKVAVRGGVCRHSQCPFPPAIQTLHRPISLQREPQLQTTLLGKTPSVSVGPGFG